MAQYGEPGSPMDFVTWLIKQRFVLTPLHGGRRGGRRGPFLAQKSPFSSYNHITPITHTTLKRMFFFQLAL